MAQCGANIRFGRAITGDLAQAERREWWVTNGLGAYASGTIAGSLTRRYHGLLIAPVEPPLGRRLLLAKADATLLTENASWTLFTNRWASGQIAPAGHVHIENFALDHSIPVWTWRLGGRLIEARIWMEPGANTVYIAWRLAADSDPGPTLRIALLANNRDHHGLTEPNYFTPVLQALGDMMQVIDGERCTLTLAASGGTFETARDWYRDFDLPIERERGLDPTDQHLHVATLRIPLLPGQWCGLVASLEQNASPDIEAALQRRLAYDRQILATAPIGGWISQLALAADAFLFRRPHAGPGDGTSVIAGYPWFGDWGRDSMISLPGLCLATGRPDRALDILRTFAGFVSGGMLPNVFPGIGDTPDYNTADASLWFFAAWSAYLDHTGDANALTEVYPVLADMIDWHQRGTRYGIGVDPTDGLLRAGQPGVQLTWMDAKVGDWVVTPRIGKPVEINALWYNALCIMADFAARLGKPDPFTQAAAAAQRGFARFLRPDGEGLFDVIDGPDGNDSRIRPNQIFAVSLPHSPLSPPQQANVVRVCRRELLTTYGLRSLAPGSADYHPTYGGDVWQRDGAYHQGTVWGWLLGPFALAEHRVTGDKAAARRLLEPMREALEDAAIGTLGEIFDAEPPHHPRGAPAQAWTVACTLDAWRQLENPREIS